MTESDQPGTALRWTDDDLRIAWEVGRDYERARIEHAADDLTYTLLHPAVTYEQRVAERMAGYATCAEQARERLAEQAARNRAHDAACRAIGEAMLPAYTTWPQVHTAVSPAVWWRIWWDLSDTDRAEHHQLAPQAALLEEAA